MPRRGRRRKFPVGLFVGLAALVVAVGGALGFLSVVLSRGGGSPLARWTRETVPGTTLSVEVPNRGGPPVQMGMGNGRGGGVGVAAVHGQTGGALGAKIEFVAVSMTVGMPGPRVGGPPADPADFFVIAVQMDPQKRLIRRYQVQGRSAVLYAYRENGLDVVEAIIFPPAGNGLSQHTLTAVGRGIDEHHPDVARFFASARYAD